MAPPSSPRSPSSYVALLLGILLPGSGHVYAGRHVGGLLVFLAVIGLYVLGIYLIATPSVPLFIGVLLVLVGFVAHCKTARQASQLGTDPKATIGIPVWLILLIFVPIAFNQCWLLRPFKMPTNSMGPTIQGVTADKPYGDHVIVSQMPYFFSDPKRGDLIVFEAGQIPRIRERSRTSRVQYLKRLVGLPGEVIHFENGSAYADGKKLTLEDGIPEIEYVNPDSSLSQTGSKFTVPEDAYFVVGDNSPSSWDSRGFGSVPKDEVLGRACAVYFPFSRAGRPEFGPDEVAPFLDACRRAREARDSTRRPVR